MKPVATSHYERYWKEGLALVALGIAVIGYLVWYWNRDAGKIVDRVPRDQIEESSLKSAIVIFWGEYGRFPFEPGNPTKEVDNGKLMAVLTADTNSPEAMKENPMKHQFFETNTNRVSKLGFLDPWGHPYHIILNRGGKVVVGGKTITKEIAIWSDGPNGKNEFGQGDDSCSWR